MGLIEAPQWLVPAFARSAKAIGATADRAELETVGQALVASWQSPDRFHHAIKHLINVLASIDQLAEETHDPDTVRVAGWYHGAEFSSDRRSAYAHKGGEDPLKGAARARIELPALGVPLERVERISEMLDQMHRHSADAKDVDAQALCDADLAGLATEPQRYQEYRRNIRAEYAHFSSDTYLEARIAILRKLSNRPRIFASPMAAIWEEPARQNIAAELAALEAELEELESKDVDELDATPSATGEGTGEATAERTTELSTDQRDVAESTSTLSRAPRFPGRS